MDPFLWRTISYVVVFLGTALVLAGSVGTWYFGPSGQYLALAELTNAGITEEEFHTVGKLLSKVISVMNRYPTTISVIGCCFTSIEG